MGFFNDVLGFFKDAVTSVVDIAMTPFKMITGQITQQAQNQVSAITDAVGNTGIPSLAQEAVNSVGGALGGVLDTAENVVDRGSDSLFGAFDMMSYLPYVALGIGGIFLLNNSDKILNMGSEQLNRRR